MINIEEITLDEINDFWDEHIKYLVEEKIIVDLEDIEYFRGREYKDVIEKHMLRDVDKHHLGYFKENEERIGAFSYCTFKSEDGKCFILDFWIFKKYRNQGYGHKCFYQLVDYTKKDGALYYQINCDGQEKRMHFWKSLGFIETGIDEYDVPLLTKR